MSKSQCKVCHQQKQVSVLGFSPPWESHNVRFVTTMGMTCCDARRVAWAGMVVFWSTIAFGGLVA